MSGGWCSNPDTGQEQFAFPGYFPQDRWGLHANVITMPAEGAVAQHMDQR